MKYLRREESRCLQLPMEKEMERWKQTGRGLRGGERQRQEEGKRDKTLRMSESEEGHTGGHCTILSLIFLQL